MDLKFCNKCKETKPLSDFNKNKNREDGFQIYCKSCMREASKKSEDKEKLRITKKQCDVCEEIKPIENFSIKKNSKDGFFHTCKKCISENLKKYEPSQIHSKQCNTCTEIKDISEFSIDSKVPDGYSRTCKGCVKLSREPHKEAYLEATRIWRKNNPEKNNQAKRTWEKNNPEKHNAFKERYKNRLRFLQNRWYINNRTRHIRKSTERKKERISTDPIYALFCTIKQNLRDTQRRLLIEGQQKVLFSKDALGISAQDFYNHITSQFVKAGSHLETNETMSMENKDKWHIDHIKPIAAFDYSSCTTEKELKNMLQEVYHYTNLQPMWTRPNIQKGSLFEGTRHKLKLPKFIESSQEKDRPRAA